MKNWLLRSCIGFITLFVMGFWLLLLSSRKPQTANTATLAGDGFTVNYCDLPALDGSNSSAPIVPE